MNKNEGKKFQKISVLHTNDMHGSYMPFKTTTDNATAQTGDSMDNSVRFDKESEIGGLARVASAVKSIRNTKGSTNVLLVDGGDTFSDDQLGNLTKGEAMIKMMNLLSYDLMVLGNHDFDYGLERTRELSEIASFPMLASNIVNKNSETPIFENPYFIIEKDGIKIGILPVGYRNTPLTGNQKNIKGLQFYKGIDAVRKYIPELQTKADIIILLSHEGMAVDKLIAEKTEGIDLIIGAHSHDVISPPVKINQTFVVQALSDAAILAETELIIDDKKLFDINTNYHYLWQDQWTQDPEMQQLIDSLRKPYLPQLTEKITETDTVIGRQYKSESPFDKMVTTMMMEQFNTDVAFLPGVGYGISLQNNITSENIYKLLPHPAKIVTLEMTGEQIRKTLEQTATNLKPEDAQDLVGGLIQSSGVNYLLEVNNPIGKRISEIKINGELLELKKPYKVTTHSGLLNGIHNYEEFAKGENISKTEKVLTHFVIDNLKKTEKIIFPSNMGEVRVVK